MQQKVFFEHKSIHTMNAFTSLSVYMGTRTTLAQPGWPDKFEKKISQNVAQPIFVQINTCLIVTEEKVA
jgi:hypothetical protein